MKRKLIALVLTGALLSMTGCTTSHTSTTEVNVTTTDESGTKEYNFSAEDNNGEVSVEESAAETPADSAEAENKGDDYNVDYDVADGNLKLTTTVNIDGISLKLMDYDHSTRIIEENVDGNTYSATVGATIGNGPGYAILGLYEDGNDSEPVQYTVIPVEVKEGEIVGADEQGATINSLYDYFPVFEDGSYTKDADGNDVIYALYGSYDQDYAFISDGKQTAFEDYTIEDTTTDQGNAAKRIAAGNAEVIFTVDNGKEYLIGADGQGYECEDVTADMAAKIIEENMK